MERVAASARGVGGKEAGGDPRVWRLGGLGPVWATLSQFSKHFYFANLIWQLFFFKTETTVSIKIFSDNFRKIK